MHRFFRLAATVLLIVVFSGIISGQSSPDSIRVSLTLKDTPLRTALEELEKKAGLPFFYPPEIIPDVRITVSFKDRPLAEAVEQVIKPTTLGYFFYRDYALVILPAEIITTKYDPAFYETLKNARAEQLSDAPPVSRKLTSGSPERIAPTGKATVTIKLVGQADKDPIPGGSIVFPEISDQKFITGRDGTASVQLPTGRCLIAVRALGFLPVEDQMAVWNDGTCTLSLTAVDNTLSEIQITAESADANISKAQIGVTRLDPKMIRKLPTLLGEADVVRSLLLSTGVTSVGEGAAGFNVRGGDVDQNLMLQDEMVLYNSSHALGFFSTYNTDLVSKVELYKSIMPAEYGGRLSSVLDVRMSEGNLERWKIKGGAGLVSGRLAVEGPLVKNKTSVIAGARVSYGNWVLRLFKALEIKRSSAEFYDANVSITHRFNTKNSLTVSAYSAGDQFEYNRLFGFNYQTRSGQMIYKKTFNETLFSRLSLAGGRYKSVQSNLNGNLASELTSGIDYWKLKELISKRVSAGLKFDFGAEASYYKVNPGNITPSGAVSIIAPKKLERESGLESALFGSAEWIVNKQLVITGGLRVNHYRYLGPKTVFEYDGEPRNPNLTGTTVYANGKTITTYSNLEPRLSGRWKLNSISALKGGYSRTSQFVNQIFNSDTPTPTSQYQLSTPYIPPFRAHNMTAGYFYNTRGNIWEMSGELFYRAIDQLWDYRDFAQLAVNPNIETEIRKGVGKAYGFEMSAKTTRPVYNGQVGYTFSRTKRKVSGINYGNWYPSNFDKPHILNLVVNYQPNQRHTLTFNFTYSTGRPTTAPLTSYRLDNNIIVPVYTPRNQSRIPDYHRLDIAYTIGQGYNKKKTFKTSWNLSVYNVYARRNAFSVYFTQAPNLLPVANRLSILGTIFPAITLNIETQ